jgi:hypothetical protein
MNEWLNGKCNKPSTLVQYGDIQDRLDSFYIEFAPQHMTFLFTSLHL